MLGAVNLKSQLEEVRLLGLAVKKNGEILETGAPAAVLGDPLLSLISLANSLAEEGKEISAGMVVITGGITNSVPFQKGDVIEVVWPMETLSFTAS
jgi:2-keto-4-pentenoate hydratase